MSTTRAFKALSVATLALITAVTLAAVIFANRASASDDRPNVPTCTTQTGTTQDMCWSFDQESGEWFLNLNHGQSFYVPSTGDTIDR